MRRLSALLVLFALGACDGDDPGDAGVDAATPATDAGTDAGAAPDAGRDAGTDAGIDGGAPDAGPPTLADRGTRLGEEIVALEAATEDVPMEQRLDGAFLDLDVAASGIDALIGEDGLMTLALSDATVRAFADLRQANILLAILDRAIAALEGRPEPALSVRTQAMALRAELAAYRDAVAAVYRERLDAGIVGTPHLEPMLFINLELSATGVPVRLPAVIEGADPSQEEASIDAFCFGAGILEEIEVFDEETGASLGSAIPTEGSVHLAVPVPFDAATAVAIVVSVTPPAPEGSFESCAVSVTTRRRLRAAPVAIAPTNEPYFMALLDLSAALDAFFSARASLELAGTIDASAILAATEHLTMLLDLLAPYRPSDMLPIPLETYQRSERQILYVRAMLDALVASEALAHADATGLRDALSAAMTAGEAILTTTSPP